MSIRGRLGAACALVGLVSLSAGGASAQDAQTCSCLGPVSEIGGVVGQLTHVHGNVQMSQSGGYAGVKADTAVYAGARIMTGSQASASLRVGSNCALDLPANATVKVDPTQGGMCVSLEPAELTIVPASTGPGLVPILVGGAAIGGAAALIVDLQDDDNSVSR